MGKLINRMPALFHLISSLPGSALRTHVESLGKPRDVNKHFQSLAWSIKYQDTHLGFSIYNLRAWACYVTNSYDLEDRHIQS